MIDQGSRMQYNKVEQDYRLGEVKANRVAGL